MKETVCVSSLIECTQEMRLQNVWLVEVPCCNIVGSICDGLSKWTCSGIYVVFALITLLGLLTTILICLLACCFEESMSHRSLAQRLFDEFV